MTGILKKHLESPPSKHPFSGAKSCSFQGGFFHSDLPWQKVNFQLKQTKPPKNNVITPINDLIKGFAWGSNPYKCRLTPYIGDKLIPPLMTGILKKHPLRSCGDDHPLPQETNTGL